MTNANESAFSRPASDRSHHSTAIDETNGLTKREYFAAMALQGILASESDSHYTFPTYKRDENGKRLCDEDGDWVVDETSDEVIAERATIFSDLLIAALNK